MQTSTPHLVIPIVAGPRLSQSELDEYIARQIKAGRDPEVALRELIIQAIQSEAQPVTAAMAA
jgi:hypothetical protein